MPIMGIMSRLIAMMIKLPPAETHDIAVEKDLKIPMPDGAILLANHYYPRLSGKRPTQLICSVYSNRTRASYFSELIAEQGFNAVVVSSRGSFGSTGEYTPFLSERDDTAGVIAWLKQQEWFNGELCTSGSSYHGYSQWAIARNAGSILKAISTQSAGSNFRDMLYSGDALCLEVFLFWMHVVDSQHKSLLSILDTMTGNKRRAKLARHLPLTELDMVLIGHENRFWREWLAHYLPGDKWWAPGDNSDAVSMITAPNHIISGWYDFFLPLAIRDYNTMKEAGRAPYLTVGPWTHGRASLPESREGIIWLRAHMLNKREGLREAPVRIFVMGIKEWREFPFWPPPGMKLQHWYLQPGHGLSEARPEISEPDNYVYNPADPTPSVGGASTGRPVKDNCSLESRPDILTYTSDILNSDIELIGPVSAELFIKSSLEHTDFFVKICDIEPSGKSLNVCDGLQRLFPGRPSPQPDGTIKAIVEMWPTAYHFKKGHQIRIQVSSGAFPRWNRNLGTSESLATGTAMKVAHQQVFHDHKHPSAVILPFIG